jgi:hypothetical protein
MALEGKIVDFGVADIFQLAPIIWPKKSFSTNPGTTGL